MKFLSFLLCLDSSIHLFYSKCGLFKSVQLPLIILRLFILHTWPFLGTERSSEVLLSSKNRKEKGGTLWLKNNKQITKAKSLWNGGTRPCVATSIISSCLPRATWYFRGTCWLYQLPEYCWHHMARNNKGANTGPCWPSSLAGCHRECTKSSHTIRILPRPQNISLVCHTAFPLHLCLWEREPQSSAGCKRFTGSLGVTWGGPDALTGRVSIPEKNCLKLNHTLNLARTRALLYSSHRLFVFDILLWGLSNPALKTPVWSITISFN